MTTLAIIGTGIAGLGCAHFLHSRFDVTLYEQNNCAGGHTNTITVLESGRSVPIDTGFMVYNEVTYPNLTRLFKELNVATKPTNMSFSVQHLPAGLEYNGTDLNHLFGQRRNLMSPRFWRMLVQIDRFNKEAIHALENPSFSTLSVSEYVAGRSYGDDFLHLYLLPMSSAVWSAPPSLMLDFPAVTLLRFFHNHGFLGLDTRHPWRTLENGAKSYVTALTKPFQSKIKLTSPIKKITRENGKAEVTLSDGSKQTHDKAILACHADQALRILDDPTPLETRLLSEFKYQLNTVTLHTDHSFMPKTPRCWAAWNYRIDGSGIPSTHYWMNRLQGVSEAQQYFVSLNVHDRIAPDKVLKRIEYEHPIFGLSAIDAQRELPKLNNLSRNQTTYYCGSYFKYGFHEDAFTSALELSRTILGESPWA